MKIEILSSGSSGNCIKLGDEVLIDAGIPFAKMGDVSNVHTVLLTHTHGDHFNTAAIRKLVVNTDAVFLSNRAVRDALFNLGIPRERMRTANVGSIIERNDWKFSAVLLYHDVPNIGWRVAKDGHKHFHATDTSTLDGIRAKGYDTATIECNHHLPTAQKLIEQADEAGEFTHLKGAINSHLSVEKAVKFVQGNDIKKLIPCHIGNSTKREVIEYLKNSPVKDRLEFL